MPITFRSSGELPPMQFGDLSPRDTFTSTPDGTIADAFMVTSYVGEYGLRCSVHLKSGRVQGVSSVTTVYPIHIVMSDGNEADTQPAPGTKQLRMLLRNLKKAYKVLCERHRQAEEKLKQTLSEYDGMDRAIDNVNRISNYWRSKYNNENRELTITRSDLQQRLLAAETLITELQQQWMTVPATLVAPERTETPT